MASGGEQLRAGGGAERRHGPAALRRDVTFVTAQQPGELGGRQGALRDTGQRHGHVLLEDQRQAEGGPGVAHQQVRLPRRNWGPETASAVKECH